MSFVSWEFPFFLALVVVLYWRLPQRGRIWLLLAASYFFYGYWDARFLALILGSTVIDYFCGQAIAGRRFAVREVLPLALLPGAWLAGWAGLGNATVDGAVAATALALGAGFALLLPWLSTSAADGRARRLLVVSIVSNLGLLGVFKYFDFFVDSLREVLEPIGLAQSWTPLEILLPVGISFYTFQSLSYSVDVYRGRIHPPRDFPLFATYIAFFPQLVAGPIERAGNLLPQLQTPRVLMREDLHAGARLVLMGLFKKIFVADNCALIANHAFAADGPGNLYWAVLGALAFAFQIYGDFSGYTDIARGSARFFGIRLTRNFRFPYVARGPSDFWERWHISLSSWFRDYLYIPLGGNRHGAVTTLRNLVVTMGLAGLWHGAQWTFVLWGLYHGLLLVAYRVLAPLGRLERAEGVLPRLAAATLMFVFTLFGWVIFRADSPAYVAQWLAALTVLDSGTALPWLRPAWWLLLHTLPLLVIQWLTRREQNEASLWVVPGFARGVIYVFMVLLVISSAEHEQAFIYFQF